jgi:hypothetical protein
VPTPDDTNRTLVEVLTDLSEQGYREDFFVQEDGQVRCGRCRELSDPEALDLDGLRRLEGTSDPADMSAVLALRCPRCGAHGTAVVRYGSEAGPGEALLLRHLDDPPGRQSGQVVDPAR